MIIDCPKDIQAYMDMSDCPHVWIITHQDAPGFILDWSADETTAKLKKMASRCFKSLLIEKLYNGRTKQ